MTARQKSIEKDFEDLKVYINGKFINQDAKLKEIYYWLLEEVRTEMMKDI